MDKKSQMGNANKTKQKKQKVTADTCILHQGTFFVLFGINEKKKDKEKEQVGRFVIEE